MPEHPGESCRHWRYQLTCVEFGQLLKRANGVCEICGRFARKPYIDHDHDLGVWAVRGLVCPSCNTRLARRPGFLERPEVIVYLERAFKTIQQVRVITGEAEKVSRAKPKG